MEYAYSLLKRKNIYAGSAQYRQNLDDQLVCPECFEQVFKKEMWVPSQRSTTHFFSHYAGRFDSCTLRTLGENADLNKGDSLARLQKISEFNQRFRNEITKSLEEIMGRSSIRSMADTIEFAERIAIEKLKIGEINKLSEKLLELLSDPINVSIDESLEDLEDAICPIYRHLSTSYGENNLYFVTAISLLLAFHEESHHLETLLDKQFIKRVNNLNEVILGNAVLLLAHYLNWSKSLSKVKNFVEEFNSPLKLEAKSKHHKLDNDAIGKDLRPKKEYIAYCNVCKNPFISKGTKTCSAYCASKSASAQGNVISTLSKNNHEYESWLSSQPWDENNLALHKSTQSKVESPPATVNPNSNSSTPKAEVTIKKKVWIKTQKGLQNKETGDFISFADTLRSVFPVAGYSVNRRPFEFIADSEIEIP